MSDKFSTFVVVELLVFGFALAYIAWASGQCLKDEEFVGIMNMNAMCRDAAGVVHAR